MNQLSANSSPKHLEKTLSYQENTKGYWQTKAAFYFAIELYAPGQYRNPELSPIITKNFKYLPPAVMINAEFDPLRDDGFLYAAKLRKARVKVREKCFAGQIQMLLGLTAVAAEINELGAMVKTAMQESFQIK